MAAKEVEQFDMGVLRYSYKNGSPAHLLRGYPAYISN